MFLPPCSNGQLYPAPLCSVEIPRCRLAQPGSSDRHLAVEPVPPVQPGHGVVIPEGPEHAGVRVDLALLAGGFVLFVRVLFTTVFAGRVADLSEQKALSKFRGNLFVRSKA